MHILFRFVVLGSFVLGSMAGAQAQTTPDAMATIPPKAPIFPTPKKPDFSSMAFLLGSWTCISHSERRGNETQKSQSTYTMSPDGYFMTEVTTAPKVSYSAVGFSTTDSIGYDSTANRWIDILVGSYGAYGFSTSTGWSNGHILWGADSFLPDGDLTSTTGTLVTKISDTQTMSVGAFTTTAGILNNVSTACTKT